MIPPSRPTICVGIVALLAPVLTELITVPADADEENKPPGPASQIVTVTAVADADDRLRRNPVVAELGVEAAEPPALEHVNHVPIDIHDHVTLGLFGADLPRHHVRRARPRVWQGSAAGEGHRSDCKN